MQYLKFSHMLSVFYDVICESSLDIIIFIIMMIIYLLGSSLMGHMLFGADDDEFKSFWQSVLSLFLISIGSKSMLDIKTFDLTSRALFGVSYMIINLILLNMLVAIYISHYMQYYGEMSNFDLKFTDLLYKIILGPGEDDLTKSKWRLIRWYGRIKHKIRECKTLS